MRTESGKGGLRGEASVSGLVLANDLCADPAARGDREARLPGPGAHRSAIDARSNWPTCKPGSATDSPARSDVGHNRIGEPRLVRRCQINLVADTVQAE